MDLTPHDYLDAGTRLRQVESGLTFLPDQVNEEPEQEESKEHQAVDQDHFIMDRDDLITDKGDTPEATPKIGPRQESSAFSSSN